MITEEITETAFCVDVDKLWADFVRLASERNEYGVVVA